MDAGCLDLVIHVRSAGVLFRHAHFWQVFPLLLRPYPALGIRYVGPCLIYRNAQQEKVCHRLQWTAVPVILCIHSREAFVGKRNWYVGRVGIAGMLCHHFPMPYGFTYEKALWHSPSLPSGVLANFPSSVSPCYASVFWFCGAKLVKGAADKIPPCYFACLLPAGFPFSLMLGESRVFWKNARNYLVIRSWSFTLLSTGKIENPDGDASADEGNKKKLALQKTEKRKNLIPLGTQA